MTIAKLPILWATNAVYDTGPDTGSATCEDPETEANGFINGVGADAPGVNFVLSQHAAAGRRALTVDMLRLHEVRQDGLTITDTDEVMAALSLGEGYPIVAAKTAQAFGVNDSAWISELGVPASVTSFMGVCAFNPATQRMLFGGTGGNRCTYSDDGGETWSAGGDVTFSPLGLVWNATHSVFMAARANATMKYGADGTAWTSGTVSNTPNGALAVFANGNTLACGNAGALAFSLSVDGGVNWADTAGVPASAMSGAFSGMGWIAGNGGTKVYHIGKNAPQTQLQISSTLDGSTWVTEKVLDAPAGASFTGLPKLLMCQNTGLLVALEGLDLTPGAAKMCFISASLDGTDWTDPMYVQVNSLLDVDAFAVAGGRLLYTRDGMLFASSGIGWR